ncbi:MAG: hypothetical protein ACHQUC_10435 [Chlamydiales bacterium]
MQDIAKKERNIDNLNSIKIFLDQLNIVENTATDAYKARTDTAYKIRTWFHRIFQFGSHSDHIKVLQDYVQAQLNELDVDKNLLYLATLDAKKKNKHLAKLAINNLAGGNIDQVFKAIDLMSDSERRDALLREVAGAFLNNKDPENALKVVSKMPKDAISDPLLIGIARAYIDDKDDKQDLEIASKVAVQITVSSDKDLLLNGIARAYINDKQDLLSAFSMVVNHNFSDLSVSDKLFAEIAKAYIDDKKDLELAFIVAVRIRLNTTKDSLLEKIADSYLTKENRSLEDINKAFRATTAVSDICMNTSRDLQLKAIAEYYFENKNMDDARTAASEIFSVSTSNPLLRKIAGSYLERESSDIENIQKAKDIAAKMARGPDYENLMDAIKRAEGLMI